MCRMKQKLPGFFNDIAASKQSKRDDRARAHSRKFTLYGTPSTSTSLSTSWADGESSSERTTILRIDSHSSELRTSFSKPSETLCEWIRKVVIPKNKPEPKRTTTRGDNTTHIMQARYILSRHRDTVQGAIVPHTSRAPYRIHYPRQQTNSTGVPDSRTQYIDASHHTYLGTEISRRKARRSAPPIPKSLQPSSSPGAGPKRRPRHNMTEGRTATVLKYKPRAKQKKNNGRTDKHTTNKRHETRHGCCTNAMRPVPAMSMVPT